MELNCGRYRMEQMYLSIQQEETGRKIKKLLFENGYTVKDVQSARGFENPQSIYKWISGKSLPSLDNFIILSRLLHTSIEDILVIDVDIICLKEIYFSLVVQ
jgi:DNA-binding helix-turn-helix protein